MTKLKIEKQKLKDLKNQLEHGDIQEIADQLGLSRSTVSKVFTGEIRNFKVFSQSLIKLNYAELILCRTHFR